MSERLIDRIPFARIFVVLAIVLGISLGLCGVTFLLSSAGNSGGGYLIGFGILELVAIGLSIAGLVLTLLVYVTLSIFRGSSEEVSQWKISSKAEEDTKRDKNE